MFHAKRVQVMNPRTGRYVLINTEIGGIISHKRGKKPYKDVMIIEQHKKLYPEEYIPLDAVKIKIDPKYARTHIVCDCGHYAKDHYLKEGACNKCGCTWYYPNCRWLNKQKKIARKRMVA